MSRNNRGFTLVELMITVAVAAVLAAIAFPSFQSTIRANRVATATNELIASVSLARSEAIRNSRGAGLCPSADGTSCGDDWNAGWLVWSDTDANGLLDAGETVLRYSQARPQMSIVSDEATKFVFDSRGRASGHDSGDDALSGSQDVVISSVPCPAGSAFVRTLSISGTGQVRNTRGDCE